MASYVQPIRDALYVIKTEGATQSDEWKEIALAQAIKSNDAKTGFELSVDAYRHGARLILFKEGITSEPKKRTTAETAAEVIARIKAGTNNPKPTTEGQQFTFEKTRSITTTVPAEDEIRTTAVLPDHTVVEVFGKSISEIDRELYEANRQKRIKVRLEREQNQLATTMMLELTGPKEVPEGRSLFDCLREPWTMASWAKQS